ncbi:MAG TPA: phosphotransferase [Clostridia bacterium]
MSRISGNCGYLDEDGIVLPEDLAKMLAPYRKNMIRLSGVLTRLSDSLKASSPRMVLCHTDAHNHNVMQSGDQLYLIDWEGIRLAPPETDFIFFVDKSCYPVFLGNYKKAHKDFVIDNSALSFYRIRRILEDLWQWIEQLLFDEQDDRQREQTMDFLGRELAELEEMEYLRG